MSKGQGLRLVLLPGLNGSDRLFAPLLPWLDPQFTVQALSLPKQGPQNPQQLTEALLSQLGETPFVLLGESFSGALAYRIGIHKPPGLRGVIFAASFLQRPQPLLRLLPQHALPLPISLLTNSWLLKTLCIGKHASVELVNLLRTEIRRMDKSLLWARLFSLAQLQQPLLRLELPTLQLLAKYDRLVTRQASNSLCLQCNDLQQVSIAGPHFLLQSQPEACAHAINRFIAGIVATQ